MTLRRFLQLDVFADRPGAGNPLAVVVDSDGLDANAMQAFAHWTNLSETIFLLPPDAGADYRVRIFTPRQELPFAGHPSVGAAWAALDCGLVAPADALVQQCAAGHLPVRIEEGKAELRQVHVRAPRARRVDATANAALLGRALPDLAPGPLAPVLWENGPRWWLVELPDEAAVRALCPGLSAIAELTGASAVGVAVFAKSAARDYQLVGRAFCPADGIPEDPVTGSANAAIAAALHADGRAPGGDRYVASQGREVGRDGRVEVRVDDGGDVWIGGSVQAVIRGSVDW